MMQPKYLENLLLVSDLQFKIKLCSCGFFVITCLGRSSKVHALSLKFNSSPSKEVVLMPRFCD